MEETPKVCYGGAHAQLLQSVYRLNQRAAMTSRRCDGTDVGTAHAQTLHLTQIYSLHTRIAHTWCGITFAYS